MQWRYREKRNDQEHHEKASFFHLAKFWMVFCLFLFLRKYLLQFLCCLLCYLFIEETFKQPFTDVLKNFAIFTCSLRPVHYTFPKFYLMIDNLYFRVIFYYCKIRPRNRKNFATDWSEFLLKRWFYVKQHDFSSNDFFLFFFFFSFFFLAI